ncbi:M12 family metallopeptidase [Hymenobacter tibetensis]|uniref:M12 family metallopeptidase n=1 Tax=Hymenobacter tibetensis TaxID=497967 RepID=A0ABY4D268_9BACT|nr:M12 family metallopeptidase [Hymenobacter tibetensis]UOG76626.1 M12 family metallopeptidase [Hymenobacter tibetensis]
MKKTFLPMLTLSAGLGALSLLAGCASDKEVSPDSNPTSAATQDAKAEEAYPGQTGAIRTGYLSGQPIAYQEVNGENVYEGDILLTSEQVNDRVAHPESAGRNSGLWPSGIIYYTIDGALPSKNRVTDAIAHWEANTTIRFVQRTTQTAYVTFRVGSGCSSNIGRLGRVQYINLASGCSTGNTIHEIGHALGLFHEQTRTDRDNFVTINTGNIESGYENNFAKYTALGYTGTDFGPLDFGSIMMYGSYSFSSNGQPTIVKKDGSTFNIQRTGLSAGDKSGIDTMY